MKPYRKVLLITAVAAAAALSGCAQEKYVMGSWTTSDTKDNVTRSSTLSFKENNEFSWALKENSTETVFEGVYKAAPLDLTGTEKGLLYLKFTKDPSDKLEMEAAQGIEFSQHPANKKEETPECITLKWRFRGASEQNELVFERLKE